MPPIRSKLQQIVGQRNWLPLAVLALIFGLSLWLRLHNLINFSFFDMDMGRDVIAVDHIVHFGDHHRAIPDSSGSKNQLPNSFLYFYVVIPFYLVSRTPEGILYSLNILAAFDVIVFYLIGKKLKNEYAGLMSAALFGIGSYYVELTHNIWQPYFLAAMLPVAFYVLLESWQRKSAKLFLLTIGMFGSLIWIHTSVLVLALPLFAYFLAMNRYFWKRSSGVVFLSFATAFLMLFVWFVSSKQIGTNTNLLQFLSTQIRKLQYWSPNELKEPGKGFPAWQSMSDRSTNYFVGLSVLGLIALAMNWRRLAVAERNKMKEFAVFTFLTLPGLAYAFFLLPFSYAYYYFPYVLLFVVCFGYLMATAFQGKRSWILVALTIGLVLFSDPWRARFPPNWSGSAIDQKREIAHMIFEDAKRRNVPLTDLSFISWVTYGTSSFFGDGSAYWYYLEKFSDQRLVGLVSNAWPIPLHQPKKLYLICELSQLDEWGLDQCLKDALHPPRWVSRYPLPPVSWKFTELKSSKKVGDVDLLKRYRVYRME